MLARLAISYWLSLTSSLVPSSVFFSNFWSSSVLRAKPRVNWQDPKQSENHLLAQLVDYSLISDRVLYTTKTLHILVGLLEHTGRCRTGRQSERVRLAREGFGHARGLRCLPLILVGVPLLLEDDRHLGIGQAFCVCKQVMQLLQVTCHNRIESSNTRVCEGEILDIHGRTCLPHGPGLWRWDAWKLKAQKPAVSRAFCSFAFALLAAFCCVQAGYSRSRHARGPGVPPSANRPVHGAALQPPAPPGSAAGLLAPQNRRNRPKNRLINWAWPGEPQ